MNFTVLADVHFGKTERKEQLSSLVERQRREGRTIIWLGDTYDILMFEDVVKNHAHYIVQEDLFITGNHDWGIVDKRDMSLGDIYLTHGDLLDFGYAFARLQQVQCGAVKGNLVEKLLCLLKKWSLDDVYTLYNLMYELSDKEVQDFHHGKAYKNIPLYVKILWKLVQAEKRAPVPMKYSDLPPPVSGKYLGYLTLDAKEVLRRAIHIYPALEAHSTLIIGHFHIAMDEVVEYKGKEYRIICLNSWVQHQNPQIAHISLTDGTIQILDVE